MYGGGQVSTYICLLAIFSKKNKNNPISFQGSLLLSKYTENKENCYGFLYDCYFYLAMGEKWRGVLEGGGASLANKDLQKNI